VTAAPLDDCSRSNAFEALLYLRRASELLHASANVERIGHRIDVDICELQEALARTRRNEAASLGSVHGDPSPVT
jgi:hypothetical protein